MKKYIVSWYVERLLITNRCKTFTSWGKAFDYYKKLKKTKRDDFDNPIRNVCLSEEVKLRGV